MAQGNINSLRKYKKELEFYRKIVEDEDCYNFHCRDCYFNKECFEITSLEEEFNVVIESKKRIDRIEKTIFFESFYAK